MTKEEFSNKVTSVVNTHLQKMLIIEKGAWLMLLVGLAMYSLEVAGGNFLLTVGGLLLATNYYLWAYKMVDTSKSKDTNMLNSAGLISFIYRLNYISLAIGCAIPVFGMIRPQIPLLFVAGLSVLSALLLAMASKLNDRDVPFSGAFFLRSCLVLMLIVYTATQQL